MMIDLTSNSYSGNKNASMALLGSCINNDNHFIHKLSPVHNTLPTFIHTKHSSTYNIKHIKTVNKLSEILHLIEKNSNSKSFI